MEFSEQYGRIVVGRDEMNTVEGLYCVVCGAASEFERILSDAGMPQPEGIAREMLTDKLFQFWLVDAYKMIRERYSSTEAPLVMETLCARSFRGQFPDSEVTLVGHLSESEKHDLAELAQHVDEPPIYRLCQLVDGLPGGKGIAVFMVSILLKPFLIDMFERDCNAVLTTSASDRLGRELMNSFAHRFGDIERAVYSALARERQ